MNRQQVVTILTAVIVGLWIITAVVRIWISWPEAYVLDAAMPLVIGYWFVSNANGKKNGVTV
jgi:hypothetical protein